MLVATCTAPGHSYRNSVERTMSILNIGFQNVSMERAARNQEEIIKNMKNLEDLRKGADNFKNAWIDSVQPLTNLLGDRVQRLILKEQPFMVKKFNSICLLITEKLNFRFYNTLLFYTIRWFFHLDILLDTEKNVFTISVTMSYNIIYANKLYCKISQKRKTVILINCR